MVLSFDGIVDHVGVADVRGSPGLEGCTWAIGHEPCLRPENAVSDDSSGVSIVSKLGRHEGEHSRRRY
jgi:hypothetical protein